MTPAAALDGESPVVMMGARSLDGAPLFDNVKRRKTERQSTRRHNPAAVVYVEFAVRRRPCFT
jgi:hypothetical protein